MNTTCIKTDGASETPALGHVHIASSSIVMAVRKADRAYSAGGYMEPGRVTVYRTGGRAAIHVATTASAPGSSATLTFERAEAAALIEAIRAAAGL